jgi:hypothetical protein
VELTITLCSDATFSSGEGLAGFIDTEVTFDRNTGLPYIRGSVVRGLLVEECANLLFALQQVNMYPNWLEESAKNLFGAPGSSLEEEGILRVGNATLPSDLVVVIENAVKKKEISPTEVLESLTCVRRQTAIDNAQGVPDDSTLRVERAVARDLVFTTTLQPARPLTVKEKMLLSACARGVRRGGQGRNRGRGKVAVQLKDDTSKEFFTCVQQGDAL